MYVGAPRAPRRPPPRGNLPPRPHPPRATHLNRTLPRARATRAAFRAHQPPAKARERVSRKVALRHGSQLLGGEVTPPHAAPGSPAARGLPQRGAQATSEHGGLARESHLERPASVVHGLGVAPQGSSRGSAPRPHPAHRVHERVGLLAQCGQFLMEEARLQRWRAEAAHARGWLASLSTAGPVPRCICRRPCSAHHPPQLRGIIAVEGHVAWGLGPNRDTHAPPEPSPHQSAANISSARPGQSSRSCPCVHHGGEVRRRGPARVPGPQPQRARPVSSHRSRGSDACGRRADIGWLEVPGLECVHIVHVR